jgi:tRNA(Ile)-lysidine synthase
MNCAVSQQNHQSIKFAVSHFVKKPPPLRRRILRNMIRRIKGDLQKMTYDHIDSVLNLVKRGRSEGEIHLPDEILVKISEGHLIISKKKRIARPPAIQTDSTPAFEFSYTIKMPLSSSETLHIKEIGKQLRFSFTELKAPIDFNTMKPHIARIDMDAITFPLTIRNILPGDRFSPLGMEGSQKVKKFFINKKIKKSTRATCPILLSNDRIIWVGGFQIDNSVRVTSSTKKILKVELLLA